MSPSPLRVTFIVPKVDLVAVDRVSAFNYTVPVMDRVAIPRRHTSEDFFAYPVRLRNLFPVVEVFRDWAPVDCVTESIGLRWRV